MSFITPLNILVYEYENIIQSPLILILGIGALKRLQVLCLTRNNLQALDAELSQLGESLRTLALDENPLANLPDFVCLMGSLRVLCLAATQLDRLPERIGDLRALSLLDISRNLITSLPASFANLKVLYSYITIISLNKYSMICTSNELYSLLIS